MNKSHHTLTIFVHGFQGSFFDFQKARNYLKLNLKSSHILMIRSITEEMNEDI
jgi:hypothetical protein